MPNQHREGEYGYPNVRGFYKYPFSYYLASDPVLFLNHQIRHEMLDSIYANTEFRFDWRRRANFILRVVQSIPDSAKAKIRRLSWCSHSLHTGGDRRSYNGWDKVMEYIATHFTSLNSVYCSFPSGENGSHRYHNWQVPRLAVTLLMKGKIQEFIWAWSQMVRWGPGFRADVLVPMATRLFTIPYDEEKDWDKGFEFRRLLESEEQLDTSDRLDRWALECLRRPQHQFTATVDARGLVLTRK
ncbi:hypothetical protein DPSP01_008562 [Paraphaeosphaeria sporulosa]